MILLKFFKNVNDDSLYWMFSASAQSIAALIALLIAGFVFLNEAFRGEEDETLIEINKELKKEFYDRFKILIWLGSLSIIFSLISLLLINNKTQYFLYYFIYSLSFVIVLLTLTLLAVFVLYIMDPELQQKVAKILYKKGEFVKSTEKVDYGKFSSYAVAFEKLLRKILENKELIKPNQTITIRDMLDLMLINQLIDQNLMKKLDLIKTYRNLAMHGGIDKIDKSMEDLVIGTMEELKNEFKV